MSEKSRPLSLEEFRLEGEAKPAPKYWGLQEDELDLARKIQFLARGLKKQDEPKVIDDWLKKLDLTARAVMSFPSPLDSQELGAERRDVRTLIGRLADEPPISIELVLPSRALVGRGFLMARLNFFRMLGIVLDKLELDESTADVHPALRRLVESRMAANIYLVATEHILLGIAALRTEERVVKERAGLLLLHLWHDPRGSDIAKLLPVLAMTWEARRHVEVAYGTLMGASEIFHLLLQGCDERFIRFLTREDVTEEEVQAFREFMFGLSTEELEGLARIRNRESMRGVVEKIHAESRSGEIVGLFEKGDKVENFYLFFIKRHLLAANRAQMNLPGPKQTAEQYVLSNYLTKYWETLGIPELP